jgi:hypothetical protein
MRPEYHPSFTGVRTSDGNNVEAVLISPMTSVRATATEHDLLHAEVGGPG